MPRRKGSKGHYVSWRLPRHHRHHITSDPLNWIKRKSTTIAIMSEARRMWTDQMKIDRRVEEIHSNNLSTQMRNNITNTLYV